MSKAARHDDGEGIETNPLLDTPLGDHRCLGRAVWLFLYYSQTVKLLSCGGKSPIGKTETW